MGMGGVRVTGPVAQAPGPDRYDGTAFVIAGQDEGVAPWSEVPPLQQLRVDALAVRYPEPCPEPMAVQRVG